MKKITLIKFGGSLISDKTKPYFPRNKVIQRISGELKEAISSKSINLILGTGAGSFGHYPAKKYYLEKGAKTERQKLGFCIVENGVRRLNSLVISSLLKNEIKVFPLSFSSMVFSNNGKIEKYFFTPIIKLIDSKIIPALYGDIVYDSASTSHIFSTENIFLVLVDFLEENGFKIEKIIQVTDVDGVLDKNGEVIKNIHQKNFKQIKKNFKPIQGYDISGGIEHKVSESLLLARRGIKTFIINGLVSGRLKKCLSNQNFIGTIIS